MRPAVRSIPCEKEVLAAEAMQGHKKAHPQDEEKALIQPEEKRSWCSTQRNAVSRSLADDSQPDTQGHASYHREERPEDEDG